MALPNDFSEEQYPFGVLAGDNKFEMKTCPFCKSTGDVELLEGNSHGPTGRWFLFADHLSAKEYTISGLCQDCQDKTFVEPQE